MNLADSRDDISNDSRQFAQRRIGHGTIDKMIAFRASVFFWRNPEITFVTQVQRHERENYLAVFLSSGELDRLLERFSSSTKPADDSHEGDSAPGPHDWQAPVPQEPVVGWPTNRHQPRRTSNPTAARTVRTASTVCQFSEIIDEIRQGETKGYSDAVYFDLSF